MGIYLHDGSLFVSVVQAAMLALEIFGWPFGPLEFLPQDPESLELLRRYQGALLFIAHVLDKQIQGLNISFLPGIICSLLLFVAFYLSDYPLLFYLLFNAALYTMVAHALTIMIFSFYGFLTTKGKYRAGFRRSSYEGVKFAVYYPSELTSIHRPFFLSDPTALRKFYNELRGPKQNRNVLLDKISVDFLSKYPIEAYQDVELAPPKDGRAEKYLPVIFSHGLADNVTTCSSLCTNLASLGYIVFAIEHNEDCHAVLSEEASDVRITALEKRVEEFSLVKKLLYDKDAIKKIFDKEAGFEAKKLTVIGYGYGGAAAVEFCRKNGNVKHAVLLDPWLFPFETKVLEQGLNNCDGLLLESESWNEKAPKYEISHRNQLFVNNSKGTDGEIIYLKVRDSDHISFTDYSLVRARMVQWKGLLRNFNNAEKVAKSILDLVLCYMSVFVEKGSDETRLSAKVGSFKASIPSENSNPR